MVCAEKNAGVNHFTRLAYAPNGECVLAGGSGTKYLGLYHCKHGLLLARMMTSKNKELDGVRDNPVMRAAGASSGGFDDRSGVRTHDIVKATRQTLPGVDVATMDYSSRRLALRIGTKDVAFSPTGMEFAAVTTEGLLIYRTSDRLSRFDPIDLDESVTPRAVLADLRALLEGSRQSKDFLTVVRGRKKLKQIHSII